MISILTLTYQRYKILEEAIQSYLSQPDINSSEMVIINDHPRVKYVCDHPNIRIINCENRFSSIGKKLEYGFSKCNGDYVFRLDDDDLLSPWALELTKQYIQENEGYDVYRSKFHYFFCNNEFVQLSDNINNGNVYTRDAINKINFPDISGPEDVNITFRQGLKVCSVDKKKYTMIYRWGMETYHISGMGQKPNEEIFSWTDKIINQESGEIVLKPNFQKNYYDQLPKI